MAIFIWITTWNFRYFLIWHKGILRRKTGNTELLFLLSSRDSRPINDFLLGRSFMIPLFCARGANTSRQRYSVHTIRKNGRTRKRKVTTMRAWCARWCMFINLGSIRLRRHERQKGKRKSHSKRLRYPRPCNYTRSISNATPHLSLGSLHEYK